MKSLIPLIARYNMKMALMCQDNISRAPIQKTVDFIFLGSYIPSMAWEVEYTDEFEAWWVGLDEEEQIDIDAVVGLLEEKGPHLPYPYSSDVKGTKYGEIRELRIQHKGKPYRILW